jgi:hypothetical protein
MLSLHRRPSRPVRKPVSAGLTAAVALALILGYSTTTTNDPASTSTPPSPAEATPGPASPAPGTRHHNTHSSTREDTTMRIRLALEGGAATATLNDTPTARDFASLLPLTLEMRDLFGREKPGQLPRPLAAGEGQSTYQIGDLGYWAPSHDLAIFYADDRQQIPSPGIVIIGRIDTDLDLIVDAGDSFQLSIEPLD